MFEGLFSKFFGFHAPKDITIWDDAPEEFRMGLFRLIKKCGINPKIINEMMSEVFLKRIDPQHLPDDRSVWEEFEPLIFECEWYKVYDICEVAYMKIYTDIRREYANSVTDLFREHGIGWKFEGGKVVARKSDGIEAHLEQASTYLHLSNPALYELQEARRAISRRPVADTAGASHALPGRA